MSLAEKIRRLKDKLKDSSLQESDMEELSSLLGEVEAGADSEEEMVEIEVENIIEELPEESVVEPPPMPKVLIEDSPAPESVVVGWEGMQPIVDSQAEIKNLHEKLGVLCANFEESKLKLRTAIAEGKNKLSEHVMHLRKENNLPDDVDYILNVPQVRGESGSFAKKQTN